MTDSINIIQHTYKGTVEGYTIEGTSDGNAFGVYTSSAERARSEVEYWRAEAQVAGRQYVLTKGSKEITL